MQHLLIKYTAQLFINKAKLVQLLLIGNAGKLQYLVSTIHNISILQRYKKFIHVSIYKLVYFDALYHLKPLCSFKIKLLQIKICRFFIFCTPIKIFNTHYMFFF